MSNMHVFHSNKVVIGTLRTPSHALTIPHRPFGRSPLYTRGPLVGFRLRGRKGTGYREERI